MRFPQLEEVLVGARGANAVEPAREPADRGRVGAAVVVDDDDDPVGAVRELVERLPGHSARERAVADDRDRRAVGLAPQACVARAIPAAHDSAVEAWEFSTMSWSLSARDRVARHSPALAQAREVASPREQLVDVTLVPGVEDDAVVGRIEDAVKRERQFHDAEVGSQVPAGARHGVDQVVADLLGELAQAR